MKNNKKAWRGFSNGNAWSIDTEVRGIFMAIYHINLPSGMAAWIYKLINATHHEFSEKSKILRWWSKARLNERNPDLRFLSELHTSSHNNNLPFIHKFYQWELKRNNETHFRIMQFWYSWSDESSVMTQWARWKNLFLSRVRCRYATHNTQIHFPPVYEHPPFSLINAANTLKSHYRPLPADQHRKMLHYTVNL